MIKIVKGDLFNATETIIGHQVNTEGIMGAGVAKIVKQMFPEVFKAYARVCKLNVFPLGEIQVCRINEKQWICNMFAQSLTPIDETGRCTNYVALRACFNRLNKEFPNESLAIPYRIGSALGGGDWDVVMDIILEECTEIDVTIYKL